MMIVVPLALAACDRPRVNENSETYSVIKMTEYAIWLYYYHGRRDVPDALDEMMQDPGFVEKANKWVGERYIVGSSIVDGWGNPILYQAIDADSYAVFSPGPDGLHDDWRAVRSGRPDLVLITTWRRDNNRRTSP